MNGLLNLDCITLLTCHSNALLRGAAAAALACQITGKQPPFVFASSQFLVVF
jgi:hypothetical protein